MKLAAKIAIGLVALLGLVFAIGGFAMVGGNFSRGLKSAEANALAGHLAAKESLRAQLAGAVYGGTPLHDATMADWGGQAALALAASGGACAVLNEGYTPCYNNLPPAFGKSVQAAILAQPRYSRLFYRFSGKTYLVFPDKIAAGGARYPFISAFDISALFSERQAQSRGFYTVYGIVLVCAALLAAGLSAYITRPLRRLEKAVQSIAAGAYAQRTGISGKDEIASLAASFDEMAAAVERQVESLTLAARQREDFMSAFTHELKTPMTAMMGYAALLEKGALDEEEKAKALGYIHSETRRLEDLSQKLLMLMGLAEGSVHLKRVRLADVLRRVRGAFPQEGARLTLPESGEAAVRADADLLADLLINLVRNGFEAQPQGGQRANYSGGR